MRSSSNNNCTQGQAIDNTPVLAEKENGRVEE